MISKPKCHISKQVANKVCVSNICTQPAFICNKCQDDQCQQLHYHDKNKLQIARSSQITSFIQNFEVPSDNYKQFLQTIHKLQKQINKLSDDVNSIIQVYSRRVEQFNKDIKIDPQFKRVRENVKEEQWDLITGKQIRMMYDRLKQDNFIMNKEEIKGMKDKETENVKKLLNIMNEKLSEYIKKDVVEIPKHWSNEDQQNSEHTINKSKKILYFEMHIMIELSVILKIHKHIVTEHYFTIQQKLIIQGINCNAIVSNHLFNNVCRQMQDVCIYYVYRLYLQLVY